MTLLPTDGSVESQFLTRLFNAAADGMILIDGIKDQVVAINKVAQGQLNLSSDADLPVASSLFANAPGLLAWLQSQVVEREIPELQTACFERADQQEQWLEFSASSFSFQSRPCLLLITRTIQDQQQLQTGFGRLNRLYTMLSKTNKAVTRINDRSQLFDEMCRIAVEEGGFRMAWMGLIDGNVVKPNSYAGDEEGYLRAIEVRLDDCDLARGPVGLAANTGEVQSVNDALNDPKFRPWRQAATDRNFQALAAVPVSLEGKVVGVFTMYSREPHVFDKAMLDVLESMSEDISFVLSHIEREKTRLEAESKLRQLSYAVEQSASAVIITDTQGIIEYINPRFTAMTGYSADEIIGLTTETFTSDDASLETIRLIYTHMSRGEEWHGEYRSRKKNGEDFWVFQRVSPIRNERNQVSHYVISADDNTELHEAQETITRLAYYDALTELPNRRLFNDRLGQAMKASQRDKSKLAVLFLDLDGFKRVNDSLGHSAGDRLLQEIARRLITLIRDKDTVARMGGDEFTIILTDVPALQAAMNVSAKIIDALQAPISIPNHEISVTTSIGIAMVPDHGDNLEDIMRNADLAMYNAKSKGRNNYQPFNDLMYEKAKEDLTLDQETRQAAEREDAS